MHRRQPAGCCALGPLALGVPAAVLGLDLWAVRTTASHQGPIPMDSESKRELWIVTAVTLAPVTLLTALTVLAVL